MRNVKSVIRIVLIATAAALSSGCAGTYSKYSTGPSVDPASTIKINGSFDIPVKKARVYFQNGAQVAQRDIDRWTTYCSVLMQNVQYSDQPQQTVLPGRFSIVDVRQSDDLLKHSRIYVASLRWVYDPPSNVIYKVEMRLRSVEQPNVRSLICEKRVDAYGRYFPTNSEIRTALGDLIEIETPG